MKKQDRDARPASQRRTKTSKQQGLAGRALPKRPLIPSELDTNDPEYVKNRIALEMFRSISIGKIIAVVGSGVTVPYGYDIAHRNAAVIRSRISIDDINYRTQIARRAERHSSPDAGAYVDSIANHCGRDAALPELHSTCRHRGRHA